MKINVRIIIIIISTLSLSGCLESSFVLSPDARIPKWFEIPEEKSRSDFKVTADYYSTFDGAKDVYKLYDNYHFFCIQKVTASTKAGNWNKTVELKNPPKGSPKGYPAYRVVTINGITDIIEHRKMEPIFYTTDDPAIWKELGVQQ